MEASDVVVDQEAETQEAGITSRPDPSKALLLEIPGFHQIAPPAKPRLKHTHPRRASDPRHTRTIFKKLLGK